MMEIAPIKEENGVCTVCAPEEAMYWGVYVRHHDGTAEWVADADTYEEAVAMMQEVTA